MNQSNLRAKYFTALAASQRKQDGKQLISKSAMPTGPQIAAIRDATGQVIGFGMAEPYDAKQELSKSVDESAPENPADDNSLFDSLFPLQSIGVSSGPVSLQKSVADPDDILASLFPQAYLSWPL